MTERLSWIDWLGPELERTRANRRGRVYMDAGGSIGQRIPYPDAVQRVALRVTEARAALASGQLWLWGRAGSRTAPLTKIEAGAADWLRLRFKLLDNICWWPPLRGEQVRYFYDVQIGPPEVAADTVGVATTATATAEGEERTDNQQPGVPEQRAALFYAALRHHKFPDHWTSKQCWAAAKSLFGREHPLLQGISDKLCRNAFADARHMPRES